MAQSNGDEIIIIVTTTGTSKVNLVFLPFEYTCLIVFKCFWGCMAIWEGHMPTHVLARAK